MDHAHEADPATLALALAQVPAWEDGATVSAGDIIGYDGELWVAVQSHTVQAEWTPDVAKALWTQWRDTSVVGAGPWIAPTGAHDTYPAGAHVTHQGETWVNVHGEHNSWEPGVYGWVVYAPPAPPEPEPEIAAWVQPVGAHVAYPAEAVVTHLDQTWINTHGDDNVWEPGVYGWVVA